MLTLAIAPTASALRLIANISFSGKPGATVYYNKVTDTINILAEGDFNLPHKEVVVNNSPEAEAYLAENSAFIDYTYVNERGEDVSSLIFAKEPQWFVCEKYSFMIDDIAALLGHRALSLVGASYKMVRDGVSQEAPMIDERPWAEALYGTAWYKIAELSAGVLTFNVMEFGQIMTEGNRRAFSVLYNANDGKVPIAALRRLTTQYDIERIEREIEIETMSLKRKQARLEILRKEQ